MGDAVRDFFVYGTLKRGQSNYPLVAAAVRGITPATIRGRLYDVGPFPALAVGDDAVSGEVLTVAPEALARLLVVLDDLEGYELGDPEGSMYVRRVVLATTVAGGTVRAYAYFYNRDPGGLRYLPEGVWHGPSAAEITDGPGELVVFGRRVQAFGKEA